MQADSSISFGDNVRVRVTTVTEERGLAGMCGQVCGETTPSLTGVDAIGNPKTDYAINVFFESQKKFAKQTCEVAIVLVLGGIWVLIG